jgi:hypothetical protein
VTPVDGGGDRFRDCDHRGTCIDARDAAAIADSVFREPSDDAGAACHIEDAIVFSEADAIQQFLGEHAK